MDFNKLFNIISPFTIVACIGLYLIVTGLQHMEQQYNILNFFVGIPLLVVSLLLHWFIVKRCDYNAAKAWLAEAVFVAIGAVIFLNS